MLALLLACVGDDPVYRQIPLHQSAVRCGAAEVAVEVVADPESRSRGLMFRRELAAGTGMLFVYPEETYGAYWMRNTFIPLSIAFLDSGGGVLGTFDMAPFDETPVGIDGAYRYALEVPQGWFEQQGVHAGDGCEIILPPGFVAS